MTAPLSHLEHALALAELGFDVFPCGVHSKAPMIAGGRGCLDAALDADVIKAWWTRWPNANVGIACGRSCWALDVDEDEGLATVADLEDLNRWLPVGPASVTGTGGMHILFAANARVKNSVRRLGAGLDTRAAGGYVVAPPSVHPNGNRYAWLPGRGPWTCALPEAPGWLLDLLDPPKPERQPAPKAPSRPNTPPYVAAALEREFEAVATAGRRSRNSILNKAAFSLGRFIARGELDAGDIAEALIGAALAAGLTEREANLTVRSGLRAAFGRAA